jgi:multiple sugar transport system permease protein
MRAGKSAKRSNSGTRSGFLPGLGRPKFSLEKGYIAYIMIAPFIIFFLIFSLYPVYNTFRLSFTDTLTSAPNDGKFIGFDNYVKYFSDIGKSLSKAYDKAIDKNGAAPGFLTWVKTIFNYDEYNTDLKAIATTWKIWLINFIPQITIAMILSVWFNSSFLKLKLVGLWRSLLYLPNMLMPATVGVIFWKFFQNKIAPANQLLVGTLGILTEAKDFMLDTSFTPLLVSFIQWWMWYGNTIVILVAGMSSISASLYESANIDGANGWKMFRYITLPSLRPILVYTLVTSLVGGMQMFDIPYLFSPNGGIKNETLTLFIRMNNLYKKGMVLGKAATIGVIILFISSIASLLIFRVLRDNDSIAERKAARIARKERKLMMSRRGGVV